MNTDQLIDSLSADVRPVPRHALGRRIGVGLAAGGLAAAVMVIALLGIRPDLDHAMLGFRFWMKWGYTGSLGIAAVVAVARLGRPAASSLRPLWLIVVPVGLLAAVGVGELASTPSRDWLAMWLGQSWKVCPWIVFLLAAPIFTGLLWSFRRLAPTRLRAAGAAAGLAAGAWAATIYCLHCPEVSALFVLTWYTLGIGLAALAGAVLGPRLFRW